jgi:biotin carboxyl carrier protein
MDHTEMEELVALFKQSRVRELTIKQGVARITLKQTVEPEEGSVSGDLVPYVSAGDEVPYASEPVEQAPSERTVDVTSPLVGVFHHTRPLVGLGAKVKEGQVIAVIEAMKLNTEVTAPVNGVISDVLIEDGMPAEYGQPLFVLKCD